MQKNLVVSLTPLVVLFGTALCLRIENSAEPLSVKNHDREITQTLQAMTQEDSSILLELQSALKHYRELEEDARKGATSQRAWKVWQDPTTGALVKERLRKLSDWEDFMLETPRRHASGQVEVVITHQSERLKAWFVREEGSWKLSGIVAPPKSQQLH